MNRSAARELALHLLLDIDFTNDDPDEVIEKRLSQEYYSSLQEDNEIYSDMPEEAQLSYIRQVVSGVQAENDKLLPVIEKFAIGWKIDRISRISKVILKIALFEISSVDDVPPSVAVNEAVKLTKKYDSDETASFVNGILGSYLRSGENE